MKSREQTRPAAPLGGPGVDPLEQQARGHLAARRFRKARDDFKLLCKKDRAKYLPLLIEANIGLIEEMLAKGQTSEAQQVLAYLKTVASPAVLSEIELQFAAKSGRADQVTSTALKLLATSSSTLSAEKKIRWADQLVLLFAAIPVTTPAEALISSEAGAIQAALEAVAAGQFERASEIVRPLPRHSLFGHWKVFVKALVSFHGGDSGKATRLFEELPADSAPGLAREPYLLALGRIEVGRRPWSESVIETVGRLHGQANWGPVLARAQALWLHDKYVDSYRALRNGVPDFPSEGPNLLGVMSDFFFNATFTLDRDARDPYFDFFEEIEESERNKNSVELKRIRRLLSLTENEEDGPEPLECRWEAFVREHQRVHGKNPRFESLAYGWLGEVLGKPAAVPFFAFSEPGLRYAQGAIVALEKSIALDPDNLAAHLKLCAVYESEKMTSKRNRLLDVMSASFPESKDVLVLAGRSCLDRKAYPKGIAYLRQAFQLDRIDPAIPDLLTVGLLGLARQYYKKGRIDEGREAMKQAEDFQRGQPENFLRNPWCHLTRRGLLELEFGDATQGTALLGQARTASPFPAAFLWFAQIAGRCGDREGVNVAPYRKELDSFLGASAQIAQTMVLVRIYGFWKNASESDDFLEEELWLARCLEQAVQRPFTTGEATELFEAMAPHQEFNRQALELVTKVLKKDRNNPLFMCYKHLLHPDPDSDEEDNREHLQSILDEATRRGDQKAAELARRLLGAQQNGPRSPFPPDFDPDWSPLEQAEGSEDGPFGPGLEDLPPDLQLPSGVLKVLAGLSDKELRRIRQECAKEMPPEFFDTLVDMARGKTPPLPMPTSQPKDPGKEPRKETSDPRQMDLF